MCFDRFVDSNQLQNTHRFSVKSLCHVLPCHVRYVQSDVHSHQWIPYQRRWHERLVGCQSHVQSHPWPPTGETRLSGIGPRYLTLTPGVNAEMAGHPLFFVTGKPNKKKGSTQTKKSFRDVRVSWWGFMEISWWCWSKKLVIRKERFYGQISGLWRHKNLKTSPQPEIPFFPAPGEPETFGKGRSSPKASWNFQSNGFFEDGVCLKKL